MAKTISPENEQRILAALKKPKDRDTLLAEFGIPRSTLYDMLRVLLNNHKIDTYKQFPAERKRGAPRTMFCLPKDKIRIEKKALCPGAYHILGFLTQNVGRYVFLAEITHGVKMGDHRVMAIIDHLVRENLVIKVYRVVNGRRKVQYKIARLQMPEPESEKHVV